MKPFFTILSDPHFGQLNFSSLIQLSLHTLYTYPYIFGTTKKGLITGVMARWMTQYPLKMVVKIKMISDLNPYQIVSQQSSDKAAYSRVYSLMQIYKLQ